jgi:hypothetical protein
MMSLPAVKRMVLVHWFESGGRYSSPSRPYFCVIVALIALIATRTSLSNIILCATLRANPSFVAIDRSLLDDKVDRSANTHSNCPK